MNYLLLANLVLFLRFAWVANGDEAAACVVWFMATVCSMALIK